MALNTGLVSSAPTSTPRHQSSDEEIIRSLTEKYGLAIASGNIEIVRQFWNLESPNLATYVKIYQSTFSNSRIEFIRMEVSRLEMAGNKAFSNLTTDERRLDKKTGTILSERALNHGACRSFEWIKTGAGWKIERDVLIQDELADKLEATTSTEERDKYLKKTKPL